VSSVCETAQTNQFAGRTDGLVRRLSGRRRPRSGTAPRRPRPWTRSSPLPPHPPRRGVDPIPAAAGAGVSQRSGRSRGHPVASSRAWTTGSSACSVTSPHSRAVSMPIGRPSSAKPRAPTAGRGPWEQVGDATVGVTDARVGEDELRPRGGDDHVAAEHHRQPGPRDRAVHDHHPRLGQRGERLHRCVELQRELVQVRRLVVRRDERGDVAAGRQTLADLGHVQNRLPSLTAGVSHRATDDPSQKKASPLMATPRARLVALSRTD